MPRALIATVLAVPLGLAIGVAGQSIDRLHPGLAWAAALGVPWLATAFLAGALAKEKVAAALAGATALVVGTATYYLLHVRAGMGISRYPVVVGIAWSVPAALSGALFASAGATWRRRGGEGLAAAAATAALAGALVGEAVLLAREWPGRAAQAILTAELVAGALLPLLLVRRRVVLPALAFTAVAAVVLGVAEAEVRDTLRQAGWQGR